MKTYHVIPRPMSTEEFTGFCACEKGESPVCTRDERLSSEEYILTVTENGVEIVSGDASGEFYARQTLLQLECGGRVPCCRIHDKPRYDYRGFMVDSARHMQTLDELKKYIDAASLLKFNRFHWHLSDDQGWRFECDAYPLLTAIGGYRKSSDFGNTHTGEVYGGYYTKAQMREIVEYCAERHITVIPEIDMPGHSTAAIAAYSQLSCKNEKIEVETKQGIFKNLLCCGKESTFDFVFAVLDEVMEIFPSEYIHIGTDEAPKNRWNDCPYCQRRMRDNGFTDSEQLQGWFANRVAGYLREHGRHAIMWNDTLKCGKPDSDVVIQNWMDREKLCADWVNGGGKMIVSDFYHYYLDYPYGMTPLKKTLSFNPVTEGVGGIGSCNILGVEAPIWTEYISSFKQLCYQCFPRLAAVAQTAWAQFPCDEVMFEKSFLRLLPKLESMGVCAADSAEWNPSPVRRLAKTIRFFSGSVSRSVVHDFVFGEGYNGDAYKN